MPDEPPDPETWIFPERRERNRRQQDRRSRVIARASSGARVVLEPDGRRARVVSSQGMGTRLTVQDLRELADQLGRWAAAGP